jgi:hypothetical protein
VPGVSSLVVKRGVIPIFSRGIYPECIKEHCPDMDIDHPMGETSDSFEKGFPLDENIV